MAKLKVTLLTGRTINQGVSKEKGKTSEDYEQNVAICMLDPNDMKELGIEENTPVKVSTEFNSIVVKAVKSKRPPHSRIIFIPYGPWASIIVNPQTNGTGMPSFKGIPAEVEPTPNERILSLKALVKQTFRKKQR